jgi:branched-chain amino acid transport system substrate-binding protein
MRRSWRVAVVVLSLAAVSALAACGSSSNKSSSSSTGSGSSNSTAAKAKTSCPVNVLLVDNFTGAGAQNGTANLGGAKVAIDEINKAGGVLGCPIKLDTVDDGSDYAKDLPLMQKAISSKKYAMVVNSDFACVTTAPLLQRMKILSVSACAQTKFATKNNPLIFDTVYIAARAAAVAADFGLKKGYKKWALMVDNTELGKGDVAAIKDRVAKGGGQVVDVEQLPLDGVNFSAAVQRAKSTNPDVIFTDLFGAAAGHLKSDILSAGWNVPQIGGFDEGATSFKGLAPAKALAGQYVVSQATMASPSDPLRQKFVDNLKARNVTIDTFLFGFANGHDPLTLFAWAANKTGSLDAQKMADYLHSNGDTEVPGLIQAKTSGYTPTCGEWNAKDGLAVMKAGFYDDSGRLPKVEIATAPPLPASLNEC